MKIPLLGIEIGKIRKIEEPIPSATIYAAIEDMSKMWEVSDNRKDIYEDIDRMVKTDEYVAQAIDILVGDCFRVTSLYDKLIDIECDDNNLKRKVEEILERSRLESQAEDIQHSLMRYGNTYGEFILYPNTNKFSRIVKIPQTWSVYRNVDRFGQLRGGDPKDKRINHCAFDQRDDGGGFLTGFYPYQILHWRKPPYNEKGEGTPFLEAARRNWLRLQFIEDSVAFARIVRAYIKILHKVPVPDNADDSVIRKSIKQYKKDLMKKHITTLVDGILQNKSYPAPSTVDTDYFMPVNEQLQGDLKPIDPQNTQLTNFTDINHFLNRLFARLDVSKARLANEKDVRAKATMIEINTAYASTVIKNQIMFLRPVVDGVNRALFFEGVDLNRMKPYKLVLPSPFIKNEKERAEIDNKDAQTANLYIKSKVATRGTIRKMNLGMSDEESKAEEDKIRAEDELFPAVGGGLFSHQAIPDEEILAEIYAVKRELERHNGKHHSRIDVRSR